MMPTYEIVDSVQKCRQAVSRLNEEEAVAVDSEGVHLSKVGPLTLLQVGTSDGHVFLFDVLREPRMFRDGGLKRLLESERVVKVLHSARNDDEALHAQFDVRIRNVHDTQLAHMELNRSDGALFPQRQKLGEVCEIYCPEKAAMLKESKGETQIKWNKTEGEFWAKRPLTDEMIRYAVYDVIAIIPEMYMGQKRLLEKRGLTRAFKLRVEQELQRGADETLNRQLAEEERQLVMSTLKDFCRREGRRSTRLEDITDENVQRALTRVQADQLNALDDSRQRRFLQDLKNQVMQKTLDDIEAVMREEGDDFDPTSVSGRLHHLINSLDEGETKAQAKRLQKVVEDMVLDDIKAKYTVSTPVKHMSRKEQIVLTKRLRPQGEHDLSVNSVLRALYWKVCLADVEDFMEKFRADPRAFTVREPYVRKLKYYVSGDVPRPLKEKAKAFLTALQEAGMVAPPPQRRGQSGSRRGGGGYYYR